MAAHSSVLTGHSSYNSFSYTYMCGYTSIKIHRCFKYIVVSSYADFFYPNNPFKINNAHGPGSSWHFSTLSVEIKQLHLYQSKRIYACKTTCNHIDPSTGPICVHDTRALFRVDLTYQIKFYKIHVISMFKLSLIFCDSLVFFERKQLCVFLYLFVYICNVVGDPIIKRGSLDWLTGLYLPYLCAHHKPWFSTEYFVSILNEDGTFLASHEHYANICLSSLISHNRLKVNTIFQYFHYIRWFV